MIYNCTQLTPTYRVTFRLGSRPALQQSLSHQQIAAQNFRGKVCSECKKQAHTYCKQDDAFFCNSCDKIWHSQSGTPARDLDDLEGVDIEKEEEGPLKLH